MAIIFGLLIGWAAGHVFIWCGDNWPNATNMVVNFLIGAIIINFIIL